MHKFHYYMVAATAVSLLLAFINGLFIDYILFGIIVAVLSLYGAEGDWRKRALGGLYIALAWLPIIVFSKVSDENV